LASVLIVAYGLFYAAWMFRRDWEALILAALPNAMAWDDNSVGSFVRWAVYFSPYARIFEFLSGCLTCQLFFLLRRVHRPLRNEVIFAVGLVLVGITLGYYIYINAPAGQWLYQAAPAATAALSAMHQNCLFAPGIVLILLGLALGCQAARLFALAPVVFLGEISYSIYLWHPQAQKLVPVTGTGGYALVLIAVELGLACLIAAASYRLIERPAKLGLRALFRAGALSRDARRFGTREA
jgi:peptidoglycan/LPS O-acetylase OafA/YrhL